MPQGVHTRAHPHTRRHAHLKHITRERRDKSKKDFLSVTSPSLQCSEQSCSTCCQTMTAGEVAALFPLSLERTSSHRNWKQHNSDSKYWLQAAAFPRVSDLCICTTLKPWSRDCAVVQNSALRDERWGRIMLHVYTLMVLIFIINYMCVVGDAHPSVWTPSEVRWWHQDSLN